MFLDLFSINIMIDCKLNTCTVHSCERYGIKLREEIK